MRKEAGFEVMDKIVVYEKGNEKITKICTDNKAQIISEVMATDLISGQTDGYVKEWSINGETVTLGVKR